MPIARSVAIQAKRLTQGHDEASWLERRRSVVEHGFQMILFALKDI